MRARLETTYQERFIETPNKQMLYKVTKPTNVKCIKTLFRNARGNESISDFSGFLLTPSQFTAIRVGKIPSDLYGFYGPLGDTTGIWQITVHQTKN